MCNYPYDFQDFRSIILNIIGGVVVILSERFIRYIGKTYRAYKFEKIFGKDIKDGFNIVYGKMTLQKVFNQQGKIVEYPYTKSNGGVFKVSEPVSFTETKSAKYLFESIVKNSGIAPVFISDEEIKEKIDISYCSLGGFNNFKSEDIINAENNKYLSFDGFTIASKHDPKKEYKIEGKFDYAVIIKLRNLEFPERTQICIAGLGESGTSGATWYLANKWKELLKKVGFENFGCVVRVEFQKDESARVVYLLTDKDLLKK
jgi:hypothetical protein